MFSIQDCLPDGYEQVVLMNMDMQDALLEIGLADPEEHRAMEDIFKKYF